MEDPSLFVLAALAILCVPGPTNTLLATAGSSIGLKRALPLLLAEGSGYFTSILIIRLTLEPVIGNLPAALPMLRLLVGIYLLTISCSVWRRGLTATTAADRLIGLRNVFITTMLNPKAIVVALSIIPFRAPHPEWYLIGFLFLAAAAGTAWIFAGAVLGSAARVTGHLALVPRIGSFAIGTFALLLIADSLLG